MPKQSLHFLPRNLRKALKPFQKEGIRYGIEKNGRCLIGDEMGLGKTLQALSIAYYFKDDWPVIIIVPSSLKYTWVDEIEIWFPEVPPEDINLIKSSSDFTALKRAKIHIISYGLISLRNNLNAALLKGIREANFGVGIVDESHFIKNRKSSRTQRIVELLRQVKRVILLTGTPSLARPEELFSQINIVNPHLVGNWQFFGERYCDGHFALQTARGGKIFRKFDTRGASNLKELNDILKRNVMIRRLKQDVLTELPAKRRQRICFEIGQDSERKKALEKSLTSFKAVVTNFKKQLNERTDTSLLTMNDVYSSMIALFKNTGLAKAGAIQEYISDLLDGMPNKFIVFCYHRDLISAVTEVLAKRNTSYIRIAGDVPPEVRANYVKEFQNNPSCRVAVLSITASCMGITLTAADHVVFAELHWTPGVIKQAEDRCHRIGQKNCVQVHFLTARGTIDDLMWSMLSRKLTVTSETLDGETQLLTADEGDQRMNELLSLCEAWLPDDNDDEIDLFTPKNKTSGQENQRDIRTCFLEGIQSMKKGTKRKTRAYYQQGFSTISDISDAEFKPAHKRSRKLKVIGRKGVSSTQNDCVQLIVDSDDDSNHGSGDKPFASDVFLAVKTENPVQELKEVRYSNSNIQLEPIDDFCHPDAMQEGNTNGFVDSKKHIEVIVEHSTGPSKQFEGAGRILYAKSQYVVDNIEEPEEKCWDTTEVCAGSKVDDNADDGIDIAKSLSCESKLHCAAVTSSEDRKLEGAAVSVEIPSRSSITSLTPEASIVYCKSSIDDSHENASTGILPVLQAFAFDTTVEQSTSDVLPHQCKEEGACINNHSTSNDTSQHEVMDSEDISRRWSCPVCTFDNHGDLSFCEICETMRPVERVRTRSDACNVSPLITAVTPKTHTKSKKCDVKLKESEGENSINAQSEVGSPKGSHNASGSEKTVNKLSDCIDVEPLENTSSEPLEEIASQTVVASNSIDSSLKDTEEGCPKLRNRHERVSFSDDVSVISESSSDVEEDWAGTESNYKSKYVDCLNDIESSSVNLVRNTHSDAMNSNFCVADAFTKGGSILNNSLPVPHESDEESTLSHDIALVDSPLLLDSLDSNGSSSAESPCTSVDGRELDDAIDDISGKSDKLKMSSNDTHTGTSEQDDKEVLMLNTATQAVSEIVSGSYNENSALPSHVNVTISDDDLDLSCLLDDDFSFPSSEKSESDIDTEEENEEVLPVELKFKMSYESDRVYLYNQSEEPLGINFRAPDIGVIITEDLPTIFSHPQNLRQLKRFSREWSSLTSTMQRQVRKAGFVFKSPVQVYNNLKEARYGSSSKDRFTSQEKLNMKVRTIADTIGGTVTEVKQARNHRYSKKDQAGSESVKSNQSEVSAIMNREKLLQAVDSEGCPICLFCNGRVQNGFRAGLSEARFCSYNCKEEYMLRTTKSRYVRERLFATEKGVCQVCKFDSHSLYAKVIALRKKDRRSVLEVTHFKDLPVTQLNRIIMDPKEGLFWEADHVTAVIEGGGECGLDNYRTLCVPCHRKVTKDLKKRLRKNKRIEKAKADGYKNIDAIFKCRSTFPTKDDSG